MSRYPFPDLNTLPEDIRVRILEVQEKAGFIPNVFLAFARRPAEWRAFFAYHDALMLKEEGSLTKGEREMIVTTTSAANQCLYCVVAHGAILRIYEKKPLIADQVAVNYRKADISPRERAMLDFAMKVCQNAHEIDDADRSQHALALARLHLHEIPGLLGQSRLGDCEQRIAMSAVLVEPAQMGYARQVHRFIEPGRDIVARGVPVVGDVGIVAGNDQQESPAAVGQRHKRILRREVNLHDGAVAALGQHERHVRGPRPALVRCHDHAETARCGKFQRALLLDVELGAEDVHGMARRLDGE